MSNNSIEEIQNLSCEERYDMFLSIVSEERDIWILVNKQGEFLKIYSEDDKMEFLPVWPHSDFTQSYSKDSKETLKPKCISVPEFFSKWVSGLEGDGLNIGVFPNSSPDIWIMAPSEFKSDLQDEFSNL